MATTSLIKIDGMTIYSHYDGYEAGMVIKLLKAINKQYIQKSFYITNVGYLKSFIAANIDNVELTLETQKETYANYVYIISSSNNTIEIFKENYEKEKMEYIETLSIFNFIKKYSKFYNKEEGKFESILDKEEVILEIKEENYNSITTKIYTKEVAINILKFYKAKIKELKKDNPNILEFKKRIKEIKEAKRYKIKEI
ncbi:hypothetical protein [Aliarcobacter skirrowii]|uniref:hypothetical protein n=1 Tax=Aliarcobacter skirrowii TaxID=28200 RepID=UPI00082CA213|nr:hypothetical protein [Aliarcobacter skirrowii]